MLQRTGTSLLSAASVRVRHTLSRRQTAPGRSLWPRAGGRRQMTTVVALSLQSVSFITAAQATSIDEALMGPRHGFSIDQLMELAGLSCACAVAEAYPTPSYTRVLVLAGPGNNGGDGLVCARHLHHFGYAPTVCYPRRTDRPLYNGLVTQLDSLGVPFVAAAEVEAQPLAGRYDVVIDALFGFSFHGAPRPPFDALLGALGATAAGVPPVVSIDVPSGWDVDRGDVGGDGLRPDMLVSLTAPKLCARAFTGRHHYLGGRFVPPAIAAQYALRLPAFPGTAQCVRMPDA